VLILISPAYSKQPNKHHEHDSLNHSRVVVVYLLHTLQRHLSNGDITPPPITLMAGALLLRATCLEQPPKIPDTPGLASGLVVEFDVFKVL